MYTKFTIIIDEVEASVEDIAALDDFLCERFKTDKVMITSMVNHIKN